MNMMNLIAASLLVLQLAGTPTPAQKPREDAVIEGTVVRLDTGEPLRRAQRRPEPPKQRRPRRGLRMRGLPRPGPQRQGPQRQGPPK